MPSDAHSRYRPVWHQKTTSGFHQRVFIMYHATETPESAESILVNGFKPSRREHITLGDGVYVSKNPAKTVPYGPITFRLLVYPGMVCKVTSLDDPLRKKWQRHYSSAWVPHKSGMKAPGRGLEENCIKSANHIEIVGVVRGYHLLSKKAKQLTIDMGDIDLPHVYDDDDKKLNDFIERIGLGYFRLYNVTKGCYLIHNPGSETIQYATNLNATTTDAQLWTVTGDYMIEHKQTGMLLYFSAKHSEFRLRKYPKSQDDWHAYKYQLRSSGALIDKWSKLPIVFDVTNTSHRGCAGKLYNPRLGDNKQEFDIFEYLYN